MDDSRKLPRRVVASVIAAGIMSFSGVVVESSMNVTFPSLMREFGIDTATVQWITTGYLLVLSVIIPMSSYLRRRFTMRALFVAGASCFLAGTLTAALAPVFPVLLAGRLVQGVGTGVALPLMFNIILEQVPRKNMGLMIGIANFITSTAPAIGPSLGGFLVSVLSWRAVFWVLVPLVAASFALGAACIRQSTTSGRPSLDVCGLIMLAVGFASFIFAANSASSAGWASPSVLGLFVVAAAAIALFCRHSLATPGALLNVRVLRDPVFALSVAGILLVQFCTLGLAFLIPNYAQLSLGIDAFTAGCLLVPGCIAGALQAPLSGIVYDRFGAGLSIIGGCVVTLASTILFFAFAPTLTGPLIVLFFVLYSLGKGANLPGNMTNGLAHLPIEHNPDGNAIVNTAQQLAGAIGTVFVSTIVASAQAIDPAHMANATAAGTQQAFLLVVVFAAAEAVCAALIFGAFKNRTRSVR